MKEPYTQQQSEALQKSIDHWKRLATKTHNPKESIGPNHCALCIEFFHNHCEGCPVMEKTGERGCYKTPWSEIEGAMPDVWNGIGGGSLEEWLNSDEFVSLAQKELEFLISLCPKPVGGR